MSSLAAGGHRRDLSKHMAAQLAMFEQGMYNLEGNLEVQLGSRLPQLCCWRSSLLTCAPRACCLPARACLLVDPSA